MWFPVEIHCEVAPQAVGEEQAGLLREMRACLDKQSHYQIIAARKFDGGVIPSEELDRIVAALDGCSVAFAGTRHRLPVGPFGAFTVASDLGIAYLEHLVSTETLRIDRRMSRVVTSQVSMFVDFLLREHEEFDTVVLPFTLGEPPMVKELLESEVGDRFHVTRSER